MSKAADEAPAMAGISMNERLPQWQRLIASKQALDFYVGQADQLQQLLEYVESNDPGEGFKRTDAELAYNDVAQRLRAILDGE